MRTIFSPNSSGAKFKVGAAYLIVAWLAVQAASIGFPAFDAPPWALRIYLIAPLGSAKKLCASIRLRRGAPLQTLSNS